MPNALVLYLALAGVFMFGYIAGALVQRRHWQSRWIRMLVRETGETEEKARTYAYARAAHAVSLWRHRVDRRPELMRHLESLATAPELGACTPIPEEVLDATTVPPVSPSIPSAAPVPAVPAFADPEVSNVETSQLEADDDTRVVDVYRVEGFL